MPKDKTASHRKVLAAAREEFMEYGYENASMRRIGQRAGMTAAGLYRHCRDKADLFSEIVLPSIQRIDDWLDAHISRSVRSVESNDVDLWKDSEIDMMRDLVYPNMEEYRLLLTRAQGSPYENFLHDLTEKHQNQMLQFLPLLQERGFTPRRIDPQELHLLLSAYTTALFEPVVHGYSQEDAFRCLETVEAFFLPGWKQVLGL
ncbi:MAG: TetR/AcrR family transcriptional regulator [Clostridia bacterium]|nr:TetR/AcrR family transcriptional regulator [Clostridia bacterium]